MIRLVKGEAPLVLIQRGAEWTAEYLAYIAGDESVPVAAATRYRHPDIKGAIKRETYEKCAYCESKVPHVAPGDVEHLAPKSKCPDRVCEWENLTYVCTECNRRKGDYHNDAEPLVDPYVDDPTAHFRFFGPMMMHLNLDKAKRTKLLLELCRAELFERRKEKLEKLQALIDNWRAQPLGPTRDLLWEQVLLEAQADKEYSAVARDFLATIGTSL